MKLLSCTVEGFGTLKKQTIPFQNGLNVFLQENGSGKTTLCAFIRAILYGLPSVRADSFNERVHYAPFDGERFGGNIILEKKGKIYRIERFFDRKSETKDECKVYCNDRLIDSSAIGQELFGLNEGSFARTVFFNSEDSESASDEEILLKLNKTVENTDGEALHKAMFLLGRAKKTLKADRGNNDEISRTRESVALTQKNVALAAKTKEELLSIQDRYQFLETEIPYLELKEAEIQNKKVAGERYQYYLVALKEQEELLKQDDALNARFPLGVPDEEELKEISNIEKEEILYSGKKEELAFRGMEEWSALNERYAGKEPSEEVFNAVKGERDKLMVLRAKLSAYEEGGYGGKRRVVKTPFWILLLLSVVAISVSFAFRAYEVYEVYSSYLLWGGAGLFALTSILFLLTSAIVSLNNKHRTKETKEELLRESEKIESSLKSFFEEYSLFGDVIDLPDAMQGELVSYHALSAEKADKERRAGEFTRLAQKNEERLQEIGKKYALKEVSYDSLSEVVSRKKQLKLALTAVGERVEKYKTEPVTYSEEEELSLREKLRAFRKEAVELKTSIEQKERTAEKLSYYQAEEEREKAYLKEIEEKARLLQKTMALMSQAEENLKGKYISPVKEHFSRYGTKAKKATALNLSLDENLAVSFEKNGQKHSEKHLSSGERAIAVLCFRLSLLDGMYREDAPFLLFDDPFVQLDEEALTRMAALMKDLATERQILYFTCHPSRKLS